MIITETSRKIKARQSLYGKRKALKQFVIITPENPMALESTPAENKQYRAKFEDGLQHEGLYAYPVKGVYGNVEHSYIVFNMPLKTAKYYADWFDQESFIFAIVKGENEVEFQLWLKQASKNDPTASASDKRYQLKEVKNEFMRIDDAENYFTAIGKNFKFSIPYKTFEAVEFYDNLFDERCQKSKLYESEYQDLIARSISDDYTTKGHIFARATLYGSFYKSRYETPEAEAANELLGI